jgi:hypothetical protein
LQLNTKGAAEASRRELQAAQAENDQLRAALQKQAAAGGAAVGSPPSSPAGTNGTLTNGGLNGGAAAAPTPSAVVAVQAGQADAEDAVAAAQQRVFEIRAEAAMLVETVEDRAQQVGGLHEASYLRPMQCNGLP